MPTFTGSFWGLEGSPTKIDDRKKLKGTLIPTSLLEDLVEAHLELLEELGYDRN